MVEVVAALSHSAEADTAGDAEMTEGDEDSNWREDYSAMRDFLLLHRGPTSQSAVVHLAKHATPTLGAQVCNQPRMHDYRLV